MPGVIVRGKPSSYSRYSITSSAPMAIAMAPKRRQVQGFCSSEEEALYLVGAMGPSLLKKQFAFLSGFKEEFVDFPILDFRLCCDGNNGYRKCSISRMEVTPTVMTRINRPV